MLTVIGEAVTDLIQGQDGRYTAHPGGSPLNVAVGLARLGERVRLKARFSTGPFGRQLREHAAASGVDLGYAVDAPEPATLAAVSLDAEQKPAYAFYLDGTADWHWTERELDDLPADSQVLHTGSLACLVPPGASGILSRIRAARAGGAVISYDPNIRPLLAGAPKDTAPRIEEFVKTAHIVKASEEDLAWLYPGHTPHRVARRWLAMGATLVVVTLGESGALAVTRDWSLHRGTPAVDVTDTVGAGDAFSAGLLSALVRSGAHRALHDLHPSTAAPILDTAIRVASITCTRAGANPPTQAELAAHLIGRI